MMYYIRSQCAWKTEKESEKEISLHGQKWEFFTVCAVGVVRFNRIPASTQIGRTRTIRSADFVA